MSPTAKEEFEDEARRALKNLQDEVQDIPANRNPAEAAWPTEKIPTERKVMRSK
jgi:hypothetical protein